jgi:hypothetical protein
LLAHEAAQRRRQVWQLVIATDVQTWKLLRRDRRLAVHETRLVMTELCLAVVKEEA